jgi:hypothetical protein
MTLPKLKSPIFEYTLPYSKKTIKFRPFTVKEEKILLLATESGSPDHAVLATEQVINNCVVDKISVRNLPVFEYQLLFINIRAKSVDNVIKLEYTDEEDNETYKFEVKLDDLTITEDKNQSNKIMLDKEMGIVMKYPTLADVIKSAKATTDLEKTFCMFESGIESVFTDTEVFPFEETAEAERKEFLEDIPSDKFKEMQEYFENMPRLTYVIKYVNKAGQEKEIEYKDFNDFFI